MMYYSLMAKKFRMPRRRKIPGTLLLRFGLIWYSLKLLTFLTRFFPFSLFYRDRKFHYRFHTYVEYCERIEDSVRKLGKYIRVYSMDFEDAYYFTLNARVYHSLARVSNAKILETIKKDLRLDDTEVFIRDAGKEKRILIAREVINK